MALKVVRIGDVTADFERRLLYRDGKPVTLMASYWDALIALVEARPNVIAHQELAAILGVGVTSVGKAIQSIRKAIGDLDESLIASERGVGYRFTGEVRPARNRRPIAMVIGLLVATSTAFLLLPSDRSTVGPATVLTTSHLAQIPIVAGTERAYFGEWDNGRFSLASVPLVGGPKTVIRTSLLNPELCGIGPRTGRLLVRDIPPGSTRQFAAPLWSLNGETGEAKPVGEFLAVDATWSPDEREVVFTDGPNIFSSREPFANATKILTLPGTPQALVWWPRFSPDGKTIRFTVDRPGVLGRSIWEMDLSEGAPREIKIQGSQNTCCAEWTTDGRQFIASVRVGGRDEIWAISKRSNGIFDRVTLLGGGLSGFRGATLSRDGRSLLVRSTFIDGEIVRLNEATQQFAPVFRSVSSNMASYSIDGKDVAFISVRDGSLYLASSIDDGQATRITAPGVEAAMPRWSPDASHVSYMIRESGSTWKVAVASRKPPRQVLVLEASTTAQTDPTWAPDGRSLIVSGAPAGVASNTNMLLRYDLQSKVYAPLPNSHGLDSPRWSPHGDLVAAISAGTRRIVVYNLATGERVEMTGDNPRNTGYPCWTRDQTEIVFLTYTNTANGTEGVVRALNIQNRKTRTRARLSTIRQGSFTFGNWIGLDSNDALLAVRDLTAHNIDRRDWR